MARTVQCVHLKKEAPTASTSRPIPGELGKRIYANVSKEAFEACEAQAPDHAGQ